MTGCPEDLAEVVELGQVTETAAAAADIQAVAPAVFISMAVAVAVPIMPDQIRITKLELEQVMDP